MSPGIAEELSDVAGGGATWAHTGGSGGGKGARDAARGGAEGGEQTGAALRGRVVVGIVRVSCAYQAAVARADGGGCGWRVGGRGCVGGRGYVRRCPGYVGPAPVGHDGRRVGDSGSRVVRRVGISTRVGCHGHVPLGRHPSAELEGGDGGGGMRGRGGLRGWRRRRELGRGPAGNWTWEGMNGWLKTNN